MLDKQSLAELADIYKEKYNRLLKDNAELEMQIDEANVEVERLRKERDEARREAMLLLSERSSQKEMREEYRKRGWSYLLSKENVNLENSLKWVNERHGETLRRLSPQEAMDKIAELDEEMGLNPEQNILRYKERTPNDEENKT